MTPKERIEKGETMKPTRKDLIDALCDILDGIYDKYKIQNNTGLNLKRCQGILNIRDRVKEEWMSGK